MITWQVRRQPQEDGRSVKMPLRAIRGIFWLPRPKPISFLPPLAKVPVVSVISGKRQSSKTL
jgi:hypothetical protein